MIFGTFSTLLEWASFNLDGYWHVSVVGDYPKPSQSLCGKGTVETRRAEAAEKVDNNSKEKKVDK